MLLFFPSLICTKIALFCKIGAIFLNPCQCFNQIWRFVHWALDIKRFKGVLLHIASLWIELQRKFNEKLLWLILELMYDLWDHFQYPVINYIITLRKKTQKQSFKMSSFNVFFVLSHISAKVLSPKIWKTFLKKSIPFWKPQGWIRLSNCRKG